jgi:hypothetical protein
VVAVARNAEAGPGTETEADDPGENGDPGGNGQEAAAPDDGGEPASGEAPHGEAHGG